MTVSRFRVRRRVVRRLVLASVVGLLAPACTVWATATSSAAPAAEASYQNILPAPVSVTQDPSVTFPLVPGTPVIAAGQARPVGGYLAGLLRAPLLAGAGARPGISLLLTGADPSVGAEGYQLDVTARSVVLRAKTVEGLFHGAQTLRQLLPATRQAGTWLVPGGHVVDYPRYPYRGAMLDVARHFLPVADVERYIDEISLYKINYLHLHLTDDQGWRIAINGWPRLTAIGASTGENGGPGGYYTQAQYRQIVAYAQARFVTVVPEIDVPAHAGAALSSYARLDCAGVAPPIYTGNGPSPEGTLCVDKPVTLTFLDDVLGQIAALTPGSYLDVGGDEVSTLTDAQYATFLRQVEQIVRRHGKRLFGWAEILTATTPTASTGEFWIYDGTQVQAAQASAQGAKLVMAPCIFTYLDMKYAQDVPPDPLGEIWAGFIDTETAYSWDPTGVLAGVPDDAILGVEAPLWTDEVTDMAQVQEMAFPRLPAIAEIGWSPAATHDWTSFSGRLAAQAPLWDAMGIGFYHDPVVTWPAGS